MGTIDWSQISELPDEFKDGRDLLVWNGGCAIEANWYNNFGNGVAGWRDGDHRRLDSVTHFAELNPPSSPELVPARKSTR